MADKVTVTNTLHFVGEFKDGDDRTLTHNHPRADIKAAEVNSFGDFIRVNKILIGDKAGADFLRFKSAKTVENVHTDYDLS